MPSDLSFVCPYCFGPFTGQHEAAVVGGIHVIACPSHHQLGITCLSVRNVVMVPPDDLPESFFAAWENPDAL